jgi:hypothetical protein
MLDHVATAATIIDVWNGAPSERLRDVLAPGYRGHMLHLADGERDAEGYPHLVDQYRSANPGARFHVVEQVASEDGLVSRLEARRVDPSSGQVTVARGINISRFDPEGRLAEEWAIWSTWLDERLFHTP